ncbi:MAG: glycyl-radical enzyme activating protein [Dehalococcoidia bacterium]|nr:glycyl-radical enzyme activating protein [Dehalococcoidia bacterium]
MSRRRPDIVAPPHDETPPRRGLIFNIQRFSIHDGPGIRTVVFFKGCGLRCRWCSNPESWNMYQELAVNDLRCTRCGRCEKVCPVNAITIDQSGRKLDRGLCNRCLECADVCPTGALAVTGQWMTVDDVMHEVAADALFYQNSGGGVTLSGGDPLQQPEFAVDLLKACKERGFHTAIETSGYAEWSILESLLEYTDLVLYDIKHMDAAQHRDGTGKTNQVILENARKAAAKRRLWVRLPLIPGYNDSEENLRATAMFAKEIGAAKVSILPYHTWGVPKFAKLGRRFAMEGVPIPTNEHVEDCRKVVEAAGLVTGVGR